MKTPLNPTYIHIIGLSAIAIVLTLSLSFSPMKVIVKAIVKVTTNAANLQCLIVAQFKKRFPLRQNIHSTIQMLSFDERCT